ASLGVLLIVSVALSAMGLWMAWQLDSIQGFHAVMNLVLFPMWLLSGAAFPQRAASQWMRWVMACNPVTYVVAALRRSLDPGLRHATDLGPSAGVSILVTILFAVAMVVLASRCVARGV
ncbi:MAG: ABC transporter permease, partial [Phycisphaerae bacterium]